MTAQGAIDPKDVVRFAEEAKPGDSRVYAWGTPDIPRNLPGVKEVRRQVERGLITLTARPCSPGRREYLMRKIAQRQRARNVVRNERHSDLPEAMQKTMALLQQAANAQPALACPSNLQIENMLLTLGITLSADYVLQNLQAAAKISREGVGPLRRRIITVISTGKRTAMGAG